MSIPVPFVGTKIGTGWLILCACNTAGQGYKSLSSEKSGKSKAPLSWELFKAPAIILFLTLSSTTSTEYGLLHTSAAERIFSPTFAPSVVCLLLSLPVKGTPSTKNQPLLSFRGSITSQTCPVLLLPFGTSPILGKIMRHSEFSAD